MRIRKRFPLTSSLSSLPFSSDPQLNRSPVVQQHTQTHPDGNLCVQQGSSTSQPSDPPNQLPPPSSDRKSMIGSENPSWFCSINNKAQKELGDEEEVKKERWEEEEKSNDRRKGSILGAEVGGRIVPPSDCSSHQEIGRWCERDKVIPLKKRKGSFEIREEKAKRTKAKMKSKTNKKHVQQIGDEQEEEEVQGEEVQGKEVKERNDKNILVAKKSSATKRGSVIMEGSRCSRVNGRGWRCCQQTLVGYSLCEHHLGKGRLRSMGSTSMVAPKKGAPKVVPSLLSMVQEKEIQKLSDDDDDDDDYDDEEEKPMKVRKKRMMKIGMVKARSMSSLLGQTSNVVVVVDDDEKRAAYEEK